MHIVNCLEPQTVYNRYLRRTVQVSCGKCLACREARTRKWVARLQQERKCWSYCFELYLDYNDAYLPSYDFSANGDYLVERQKRFYVKAVSDDVLRVPLADLMTDNANVNNYLIERLNSHYTALPHPSVRDIQLFKKRLNKYIYELTGKYKSYRYAICAEIGPTTFRPHYHGVVFFNGTELAEKISLFVAKAWQDGSGHSLGHAYAKPDRGGTVSYVTKYICRPTDLPSCYSHASLRPFFLTSRNPPIGSLLQSDKEVREIFFAANPQRVELQSRDGKTSPVVVPLGDTLENKLFPKCPLYGEISPTLRVELYKSALTNVGFVSDFDEYVFNITCRISRFYKLGDVVDGWEFPTSIGHCVPSQFSELIGAVTHDFESVEALRPLHRVLCRIWFQSQIFGVSYDFYIKQIMLYYDRKELLKLKCLYAFQKQYIDDGYPISDIDCMYQFRSPAGAFRDTKDYKAFAIDTQHNHNESVKTIKKNAYFESLKVKDNPLYNLILNYYNGEKCYESLETVG